MIKSLLGGGLVRLLQALDPSPEKALVIDASGNVAFEDRLINKLFTPGITAATPGDLSVAFTTNQCRYDKIGDFVDVSMYLVFTPTYTTATGNFIINGLPFAADSDAALNLIPLGAASAYTWQNAATIQYLTPQAGATTALIQGLKSGTTVQNLQITAFPSGTAVTLRFRGRYRTTRV